MTPNGTEAGGRTLWAPCGVVAAALLFSTGGAAIKYCSLTGWQVASFRSAVAALVLLAAFPAARRGWTRHTPVVALSYALTLILFVRANKLTTAAHTIFLQSGAPLWVLLLAPWLLRERPGRRDIASMGVLVAGMLLLFLGVTQPTTTAPDPSRGNLLAVASGVCFGLTIVGLRAIERQAVARDTPALTAVIAGNALACLLALPWALPVTTSRMSDWLAIGYLGVFQIGLAYVCLTASLRQVPALEASLLLLVEPVLNPLWAWLVQGERLGRGALVGGALIIGAIAARAIADAASRSAVAR